MKDRNDQTFAKIRNALTVGNQQTLPSRIRDSTGTGTQDNFCIDHLTHGFWASGVSFYLCTIETFQLAT